MKIDKEKAKSLAIGILSIAVFLAIIGLDLSGSMQVDPTLAHNNPKGSQHQNGK